MLKELLQWCYTQWPSARFEAELHYVTVSDDNGSAHWSEDKGKLVLRVSYNSYACLVVLPETNAIYVWQNIVGAAVTRVLDLYDSTE